MLHSTSYRSLERLTQLWQSEPNKKVKEEMKGENREHGRKKSMFHKIIENIKKKVSKNILPLKTEFWNLIYSINNCNSEFLPTKTFLSFLVAP